ncbi:MAG: AAA family ATPase [Candidatus Altiarchaeota archaeon]
MKISKIPTAAFAIAADVEENIKKRFSKDKGAQLRYSYLPVGRFHVTRTEQKETGLFFKKTAFDKIENYFYFDMAFGDLFYLHREHAHKKNPRLDKSDFIRRVWDYPDEYLLTLGQLHEYGSLPHEELNRTIIMELVKAGFAEVYEPDVNQLFNFLRNALDPDDLVSRKYLVRPRFNLPTFGNSRYELDSFLKIGESMDDRYEKDPIHFSHERMYDIFRLVYNGGAVVSQMTYLPYVSVTHKKDKKQVSEIFYPLAGLQNKNLKQYFKNEVKCKPISFMTTMGVSGSVPLEGSTIDFGDVADMEEVKQEIREKIIYPLAHPEVSKEYGKKAGGSILFYGPPGCGKTYIARATVGECGINFFNVNTSDIMSGTADEGAKNIHEVFVEASRNAPSILFFDELDALGGRRSAEKAGEERIVTNQFLMEMDGVESLSENMLIVGSTNVPWELDPALRRAGRFNDQIYIPPPNTIARVELFKIHTRKKPVSKDLDFEKLSELTNGFSSADVKAVIDDAIEVAWEEALRTGNMRPVTMEDFMKVLKVRKTTLTPWYKLAEKEIRKSGESGLYEDLAKHILRHAGGVDQARIPGITFKDVGGLGEVKEKIKRSIVYPLTNPELAKKFGQVAGGGFLLYGPPGCGKTYIAKATAGECKANFFNIKITDIISGEEGQAEKNLANVFDRAQRNAPAILFFDELDALAPRRESAGGGVERRIVNQFLSELDGFEKKEGVMVIASTNAPWDIDPALRRSGRFTHQAYIPIPDYRTRVEVLNIHLKDAPIAEDIDIDKLSDLTQGYSSADLKAVVDHSLEIPWEQALHGEGERLANMNDFERVITTKQSSLPAWYQLAKKQLTESGEKEIYTELWGDLEKFHKKSSSAALSKESGQILTQLQDEKQKLEDLIRRAKSKYYGRELDQISYRELIKEYQKRIMEIEYDIRKISKKGTSKKDKKDNGF